MSDVYNYPHFLRAHAEAGDFEAFTARRAVGASALDGELVDAATGERVTLSSLWKRGPVLIEFGSIT